MTHLNGFMQRLRRAALRGEGTEPSDVELLGEFVSGRDQAAFEALVRRHGPMVWGVCRRVLPNEADAEDAFQATFLVLVRKAGSITARALVGSWLYRVAYHTALKARAMSHTRRAKERQAADRPRPGAPDRDDWQQTQALLDEELSRLPEKYQAVLVLCDLEDKSRKEAARQLGVPEGTVAGRLARARALLAGRLARRGVVLPAGALALFLSEAASAGVPAPLVVSTVKAANVMGAGRAAAGVVPIRVAALTEGVIKAMFLTRLKIVTVLLLATALLGGTAGLLVSPTPGQDPGPAKKDRADAPREKGKDARDRAADEEQKALEELKKTYALADGEDLKCVQPPFPAARKEWFRAANSRRALVRAAPFPAGPPAALVFRWNKGELKQWGANFGGGPDLPGLLSTLARIYAQEMEGDEEFLKTKIEADFIVRQGAPAEKVVGQLETILRKQFQWPVRLALREVERKVHVASGTYRFVPVEGRPADRIELYARALSDPKFGGGGSGDFPEFLQWAGRFIGKRIVAGRIENAPTKQISWHDNTPHKGFTEAEWAEAHDAESVLKHLSEQTGLKFKEETRAIRVLFVERKE
jgi:RNA polymerase sigma factor (sigma-70 family)